ncbi:MAG TPA: pyruvate kinase, partial [Bacteroidota bacterium]|nr:pyruvate kinase [Bacteroidota bacterium]
MKSAKTKIVCTIGPACNTKNILLELANSGMDVARLNFSHGDYETHSRAINNIREIEAEYGFTIGIMQDIQGPKIRIGLVENGAVNLIDNQEFVITTEDIELGNSKIVSTSYKDLPLEVKPGNTILIDDGYIILKANRIDEKNIYTTVIKGGILKDRKGIIVPKSKSIAPTLNEKDLNDLKFGLGAGIDFISLSFVRSHNDLIEIRTAMKIYGRIVPLIAKIERAEAFDDIDEIIQQSDGIMIARGDLGLEMPLEDIPILQKELIHKANKYGKPAITATQMLESMINNPLPTRAEVT